MEKTFNWDRLFNGVMVLLAIFGVGFGISQKNALDQEVAGRTAFSQQSYDFEITGEWTLQLEAAQAAYDPSAIEVTPVFLVAPGEGLDVAIGTAYRFEPDQIRSGIAGSNADKRVEVRNIYDSLCGRPENIDRCTAEEISVLKITIKFPTGGAATQQLDAPPRPGAS